MRAAPTLSTALLVALLPLCVLPLAACGVPQGVECTSLKGHMDRVFAEGPAGRNPVILRGRGQATQKMADLCQQGGLPRKYYRCFMSADDERGLVACSIAFAQYNVGRMYGADR
jgi:hypothetical protein